MKQTKQYTLVLNGLPAYKGNHTPDQANRFSHLGGRMNMCSFFGLLPFPAGRCTRYLKDAGWSKGDPMDALEILCRNNKLSNSKCLYFKNLLDALPQQGGDNVFILQDKADCKAAYGNWNSVDKTCVFDDLGSQQPGAGGTNGGTGGASSTDTNYGLWIGIILFLTAVAGVAMYMSKSNKEQNG